MPKLLIVNHSEVEQLLTMPACIDLMASTLASLARDEFLQPLRTIIHPRNSAGVMALMPAYRSTETPAYGLKAICVFSRNPAQGLDSHQGGVLLFSGETGELQAVINASAITAIRTAAVSGVATRLLAREDASELAIIGAGVQARSHLEAISCVRTIRKVRIASRRPETANRFAGDVSPYYEFPIEPVSSAQAAIEGADIIVTATTSHDPVLRREWIAPGAHINAIGTYSRAAREIDAATIADATLFVDRRESALNEAGDYLLAAADGVIGPDHIKAELGELLIGARPARRTSDEITLFKSLGIAVEDLAAAEFVFHQAQLKSAGTWVDF